MGTIQNKTVYINGRFLSRPLTGVERVASEVLRELVPMVARASDPDVTLVALAPKMSAEQEVKAREICTELHLPLRIGKTSGYLWEQLELLRATRGGPLLSFCNLGPVLKRRQMVVIHDAQVYTQPGSYSGLFRKAYKILLPLLGRMSRYVVTVSKNTRLELETFGVLPKGKARVIYNAADHILRIKPKGNSKKTAPYFLVLGSQAAHKNIGILIKAMQDYKEGDVPLAIVGGNNSKVFKALDGAPLKGVTRLGRVDDCELAALYQGATALLFPSLTEGFGIPPLEAMQLGCPVITSDGGAIPEVCAEAALYVSPMDAHAWSEAMKKVSGNDSLRASMAEKGVLQAQKFSWKKTAAQYLQIVEQLVLSEPKIADSTEETA